MSSVKSQANGTGAVGVPAIPDRVRDVMEKIAPAIALHVSELTSVLQSASAAEQAEAFVRIRDYLAVVDQAFEPLNDFMGRLRNVMIPQAFEGEGLTTITLKSGSRITISQVLRASIREGQRDAAYDWLRANGLDALIIETVNASTLASAARHRMEEGEEIPEAIFNVHLMPQVSVTKVNK